MIMVHSWCLHGAFMVPSWCLSWCLHGASPGPWTWLCPPWASLGSSWAPPWPCVGHPWAPAGPSLGHSCPFLGPSGQSLGPPCALLGLLAGLPGPIWAFPGALLWPCVGLPWAPAGPSLRPLLCPHGVQWAFPALHCAIPCLMGDLPGPIWALWASPVHSPGAPAPHWANPVGHTRPRMAQPNEGPMKAQ